MVSSWKSIGNKKKANGKIKIPSETNTAQIPLEAKNMQHQDDTQLSNGVKKKQKKAKVIYKATQNNSLCLWVRMDWLQLTFKPVIPWTISALQGCYSGSEKLRPEYFIELQPQIVKRTVVDLLVAAKYIIPLSFMQPYMRLCGCSVCGDFWPPTGTERRPSSAGGRRWGPGRETTPLTQRHLSAFCICRWADIRCSENSRRLPESRDLTTRRDNSQFYSILMKKVELKHISGTFSEILLWKFNTDITRKKKTAKSLYLLYF